MFRCFFPVNRHKRGGRNARKPCGIGVSANVATPAHFAPLIKSLMAGNCKTPPVERINSERGLPARMRRSCKYPLRRCSILLLRRRRFEDAGWKPALRHDCCRARASLSSSRLVRKPPHTALSGPTRTSILPMLSPLKRPMKAFGAFSMPSSIVSFHSSLPAFAQPPMSRMKSGIRLP